MTSGATPKTVSLVEVGPRDGLQNEPEIVSTASKLRFIELLVDAGATRIEVASFVNPARVPQMADAAEVCQGLPRRPDVRYSALVPNLKGLERATAAGLRHIAVFAAASETFSQRNLNQGIDASLVTFDGVVRAARATGIGVRAYVSTSFGCPFEGPVDPVRVSEVAGRLLESGAEELAISDTIGVAHPAAVEQVLEAVGARVPMHRIALHFHDTRGTALANILRGLQLGVRTFDTSAGGLGGCPFAPGATGNVSTEDVLFMLQGMGCETGLRFDRQIAATAFIEEVLGRPLPSRCYRATRARPA